jgi:hypothetical protein
MTYFSNMMEAKLQDLTYNCNSYLGCNSSSNEYTVDHKINHNHPVACSGDQTITISKSGRSEDVGDEKYYSGESNRELFLNHQGKYRDILCC